MIIRKLTAEKVSSIRINRGMTIRCIHGNVWATVAGKDIILGSGEQIIWNERPAKLVILPVKKDAVVAVAPAKSLLQEFTLFDQQPRLTASLVG
mgnify:CR=1 FL=1